MHARNVHTSTMDGDNNLTTTNLWKSDDIDRRRPFGDLAIQQSTLLSNNCIADLSAFLALLNTQLAWLIIIMNANPT